MNSRVNQSGINSLHESDRRHWIHPVSNWRDHESRGPKILKSGKGAYVVDSDGHSLLDGFSGLWCVNIGYGQQSVVDAASRQMSELPYATAYFDYASESSILFADKLAALTPSDLNHVYFTLGGSDAVDSAIRFVRYYNNALGRPEKKAFIGLERAFHGSSSTSSGLTALSAFHHGFDVPSNLQHHIPSPYPYRNKLFPDTDAIIEASCNALRSKVEEIGESRVAAFICEPIQGSGGVIVPPTGWLRAIQSTCRELGILFIVDEVITGFGRTGPLFACEAEGVAPDMMTVAKGLTSGYSPMGALFVSDAIYDAIAERIPTGAVFGHGYTYSGHPVSAAVGLEVLRLYFEGGILANGQKVGRYFEKRIAELTSHPIVGDVRGRGMLAALELVTDKKNKLLPDASIGLPRLLTDTAYENGLIFRAFADGMIGLAPPLCCTEDDIDTLMERLIETLNVAEAACLTRKS